MAIILPYSGGRGATRPTGKAMRRASFRWRLRDEATISTSSSRELAIFEQQNPSFMLHWVSKATFFQAAIVRQVFQATFSSWRSIHAAEMATIFGVEVFPEVFSTPFFFRLNILTEKSTTVFSLGVLPKAESATFFGGPAIQELFSATFFSSVIVRTDFQATIFSSGEPPPGKMVTLFLRGYGWPFQRAA